MSGINDTIERTKQILQQKEWVRHDPYANTTNQTCLVAALDEACGFTKNNYQDELYDAIYARIAELNR